MIVKDAYKPIAVLSVVALLPLLAGWWPLTLFLLILPVYVAYFFRDPERKIPEGGHNIVSPADGRVIDVAEYKDGIRISIFMNIFNVHVNRSPIAGRIKSVEHTAGRFVPADREDAASQNERNRIEIDGIDISLTVVQVAGLIARRIVFYFKEGDSLEKGQRLGLIKFGSRVDVYLPPGLEITVKKGDNVKGGLSIVAVIPEK